MIFTTSYTRYDIDIINVPNNIRAHKNQCALYKLVVHNKPVITLVIDSVHSSQWCHIRNKTMYASYQIKLNSQHKH